MPNDNIQRIIQRASGDLDTTNYEELVYEGYGPAGVAVLINIMTDNRNRTAGEIRHIFSKNGGNLGETGCVAWMFDTKGVISINPNELNMDADELMLLAIEAGAEDIVNEDETIQIYTSVDDFENVKNNLTNAGIPISSSEITKVPQNTVLLTDLEQAQQVLKLLDLLEDNDDVQAVYANFEIASEIADQVS